MARTRRIDTEGAIHHITSRGNDRRAIFLDDVDRRRFMGLLSMVCDRYGLRVLAYALMDNHFHLALRCPDAGVSAAMRDLKSQYAKWFRYRHGASGPIYDARFYSGVVTSHRQLKRLVRYIHRNPLSIDKHMALGGYPWSSHGIYTGCRPAPVWFDLSAGRDLFRDLRREIENPMPNDEVQNCPSEVVPGTASLSERPGLADIRSSVACAGDVENVEVRPSLRNGLIGIAVNLALDEFGFTSEEVAAPFGYRTPKAVETANQRARARLQTDSRLAAIRVQSIDALVDPAA